MGEKKSIKKRIVETALLLCNIAFIIAIVVFVWRYTSRTRNSQERLMRNNFCNTVETMKQISQNHFNTELSYVDAWNAYIKENHMTLDEAVTFVNTMSSDKTVAAHFVDMDTFEATSSYYFNGDNAVSTYSYFRNSDVPSYLEFTERMIKVFNGDKTILGQYRIRESQRTVVSVGTRTTLRLEDGTDKDYLLLRTVPIDKIKKLWVFPTGYENAEIGLLTDYGDYVIPSYAMRSENFVRFLEYYNFDNDTAETDEFISQLHTQNSGLMTLKDSRGQSCYWYYSSLDEFSGIDIMGYIPVSSLTYEGNDLLVVGVVSGTLLFLVACNGLYILAINRKLKKTAEAAKQANYLKTRFLSTMSHDIRTPLNAVLGMTELAQNHIDDADYVRECLRKITISGNHLLTLINDILDITRIESGKVSLTPAPFAVEEFFAGLECITRSQAVGHGLNFEITVDNLTSKYLIGDKLRLTQIYLNLLNNAIKYTPSGGSVKLAVREESLDEDGNKCLLVCVIADTGVGMSEEFRKNMYDAFVRATDGRISKIQGSGLGLAIVKRMVDIMNGTIDCESEEGKGTTFTVKIPLETATEPADEQATETGAVQNVGTDLNGLRVLIAEDNDINWEIISALLDGYGLICERAVNGRDCLDKLFASAPDYYDLVFMDLQMPLLNGLDATDEIRTCSRKDIKNIPVIAMTADAFAEDIQRCIDAGMNAHVSKPIEIDKVISTIRLVLSRNNDAGKRCE